MNHFLQDTVKKSLSEFEVSNRCSMKHHECPLPLCAEARHSLCTYVHLTGHTRTQTNTERAWCCVSLFYTQLLSLHEATTLIKMVLAKWTYGYQMFCLLVLSFLCFPFHGNKLGRVCNCQNTLPPIMLQALCYLTDFFCEIEKELRLNFHFDSSYTHTHVHTVHSRLSVTYHLPLGFWTSLLLKLCDLAAHTAENAAPRRSLSVCVRVYVSKMQR